MIKMNEKEIEFIKHCEEHVEFLTGGRGHSKTKQIIEQLQQENKQLKERITYLENSNNRREETIISLRHEQQLDKYKEVIEEVRELKDEYVCSEEYCGEVGIKTTNFIIKLGQILNKVKGE